MRLLDLLQHAKKNGGRRHSPGGGLEHLARRLPLWWESTRGLRRPRSPRQPAPATIAVFSSTAREHMPRYSNPRQVQVTSPASSTVSWYGDPLPTRERLIAGPASASASTLSASLIAKVLPLPFKPEREREPDPFESCRRCLLLVRKQPRREALRPCQRRTKTRQSWRTKIRHSAMGDEPQIVAASRRFLLRPG